MTPLIVCMKWGDRYGPDYVNRLHSMCARHMRAGFDFVCMTDDPSGLAPGIDARPLPPFEGVPLEHTITGWRKLSLWRDDLDRDLIGRDALALDLDIVVTGPLDDFFAHEPGRFAVWRNPTKPNSGIGNTSVYRLKLGAHPEICARFTADPERIYREDFKIEQEFISARLGDGRATRDAARSEKAKSDPFYRGLGEQTFWPDGWCLSFKEDLMPGWPARLFRAPELPPGARVVAFHGKPDPDEAMRGEWPEKKTWKRLYKRVRPVRWIEENWR
jgi:hypothetical protein